MPGRGSTSFGKYVSRNFQRPDIGMVKAKVNEKTQDVKDVVVEVAIPNEVMSEIPKEDSGLSVDALITKRKETVRTRKKKSPNKQKNTN